MALPSSDSAAATDILATSWRFPRPLNTTFVSQFSAQLKPSVNSQLFENGTVVNFPATPFGSYGSRPDIIFASMYELDYEQRVSGDLASEFGREYVVVRSGDTIALDWEGDANRTVAMTCHECLRYFGNDGRNAGESCERFSSSYSEMMSSFSGTLTTNTKLMDSYFSRSGDDVPVPVFWQAPNTFAARTPFIMPHLSGTSGVALCMFTLDWDSWKLNTKHSVPFPVYTQQRLAGRMEDGSPVWSTWAFNASYPTGIQVSGFMDKDQSADDQPGSNDDRGGGDGNRSPNRTNIGTIVSAVLGSLATLVIILFLLRRLRRAKQASHAQAEIIEENDNPEPKPVQGHTAESVVDSSEPRSIEEPLPTYDEATREATIR